MKTILITFVTLCALTMQAKAQDIVVVTSPYQVDAKASLIALAQHLSALEPNSTATLIDGYDVKKIGVFTMPPSKVPIQQLMQVNGKVFGALMRLFKKHEGQSSNNPNALNIPQALHYVAENYAADNTDILLIGSPFYHTPQSPKLSMLDAHIPSDGHISAHRANSVFGSASNDQALKGLRIHMAVNASTQIINEQHRYFLKRFWTLNMEAQGGTLVSYEYDINTVFERVFKRINAPKHNYILDTNPKREMLHFRIHQSEQTIFERSLSTEPLAPRITQHAQDVELGISWDCENCDLDIYARPWAGAPILYFNNTKTPQGKHLKDFTGSPKLSGAFETISFNTPLDLTKLEVAVNFYAGHAPKGVKGELRLTASGRTYAKAFYIKAKQGETKSLTPHAFDTQPQANSLWFRITAADIIPVKAIK